MEAMAAVTLADNTTIFHKQVWLPSAHSSPFSHTKLSNTVYLNENIFYKLGFGKRGEVFIALEWPSKWTKSSHIT